MFDGFQKKAQALGTYAGSKRRLLPFIFKPLLEHLSTEDLGNLIFVDAFSGGGSVSLFAKMLNFKQVLANDWSDRGNIIGRAVLENNSLILSNEDLLYLYQPLPETFHTGFIQQQYSSSVFSIRHAEILDRLQYGLEHIQNPVKRELSRLLLWHLVTEFVAFPTSIGTSNRPFAECLDGLRDWDSLNPKRFSDGSVENLLRPTWSVLQKKRLKVNRGIFKGAPVRFSQLDAVDFISKTSGDIAYFDPPYAGTLSYEKTNRVLDSVLFGRLPEKQPSSSFTNSVNSLNGLFESSRHIPIWAVSYGNLQVSMEELVALIQRHVPDRTVTGYSTRYQHMPHVSKSTTNQELFVLAY